MSSKFNILEKFRRPELFLAELLSKSSRDELLEKNENARIFYRATVLAIDVFGGRLENNLGAGTITHIINGKSTELKANIGPDNPKNSIKARILSDNLDQFVDDNDTKVFWPLFSSHDAMPIKPGEHVYVMFEDYSFSHGLWISKVPGHENVNRFIGENSYKDGTEKSLASSFGDNITPKQQRQTDKIASGRLIDDRLTKLFK